VKLLPPDWVPASVAAEISWILHASWTQGDLPLLWRLATDERMESVWRELKKHEPCCSRAELEEIWTGWKREALPDLSDSDIALRLVFYWAFGFPACNMAADTLANHKALIRWHRELAGSLHTVAGDLRLDHDPDADKHADAIERAAAWCETKAVDLAGCRERVVHRDRGNLLEQGVCRLMAHELQRIYGRTFRGTLATILSVITQETITAHKVRDWLMPPCE
jgi:hypothetical protein